jgi:hypothetical protein
VRFYQRMRGREMLSGNNRKKQHRLHITCNVPISDAFPPKKHRSEHRSQCRAGVCRGRQGAGYGGGGMLPRHPAGSRGGGMVGRAHPANRPSHMPALGVAAGPCRRWQWRQVPRAACPAVPPLSAGLFWQ